MRFVCESCRAQYMINDEKVGPKGVKVRCRKCGYVILVKRADAAKAGGPVAMSNDPDDALATQVMQTPLAAAEATLSNDEPAHPAEDMTNPGTSSPTLPGAVDPAAPTGKPNDSFFGADEDEIGAVFDQVLKGTGSHTAHKPDEGGSPDDRQSTRVIDADTVRKLAEESGTKEKVPEPPAEEVPTTDWYVAINEKQTGPLTLEKVKEHWDRGEISPDSLCWRAGYDDWIPVSDVKMLNSVLAPKPPKPIVVAPAATITQSGPAVMNVPVQSAFSAGGMVQTMQSQMQVPMSAAGMAGPEETNSWKPSAASSLGSLLKDEMDAQSRPPPKPPPPVVAEEPQPRGLLDVPHHEDKPTNGATVLPMPIEHREPERPARPAPPPPNPYLQNPGATYSAPAMTQYRPPNNRNLMIGVAAGGAVMLLILVGLIVWLATRAPPQVVVAPQPPVVVQPPPVAVVQPPPVAVQPPPTAVVQPPPTTNPTGTVVAAVTPPPTPVPAVVAPPTPVQPKGNGQRPRNNNPTTPRVEKEPVAEAPSKPAKQPEAAEDDFDSAFGGPKKAAPKNDPPPEKKGGSGGYIPPAPGAATVEVKESLGQGDIMEVVLANKGALGKCVEEQRKKDPGTSGKLLMKWTILTSGKTSNVSVASEEFKGTPIAGCVGGLIKGMTFPRSKKQGDAITFPFKF